MGQVYLVVHPRLPRQEALKVLSPELSGDPAYRMRFAREADLAAKLWHPNIVEVRDRGETDGQLWISMAYVEGNDAAELLRSKYPAGMPIEEVAAIVAAVASALDYAHDQDLLHRDVKPANIFLSTPSAAGETRILLGDFGIARELSDTDGLTATNMTLGTVAYAAPEQLSGDPIDGRADQYALAATAYHLLTGAPLFPSTNPVAVISRHLQAPPPKVSAVKPDLAAVDAVLEIALSKNPADRFPRCGDFSRALSEAAESGAAGHSSTAPTQEAPKPVQPVAVPPKPAPVRPRNAAGPSAPRPPRKPTVLLTAPPEPAPRRRSTNLAVLVAVLAVGGLIGVLLLRNGMHPREDPVASSTATVPLATPSGLSTAPVSAPSSPVSTRSRTTTTSSRALPSGTPWFASTVGQSTRVLAVTGTGGSTGSMDTWQRTAAGWQRVFTGIPVLVGTAGLALAAHDDVPATPMGVYSLDFAFGSQPDPGTSLKYVQTTPDHWWSAEGRTYNTMQVCKAADCPFNTSEAGDSENLYVPAYRHAIVMGVNKDRIPGHGGGFFIQSSRGMPTAGGIAVDDASLVEIIRWLQPGAVIAIQNCHDDRCSE